MNEIVKCLPIYVLFEALNITGNLFNESVCVRGQMTFKI